ncbi:MAG: response regulator [Polyangiaceae bacterium]|nr:response regulator [Polyangiaceae bacterium]MCW5791157.1 response regulator [Polyangiaceae bacterium]
MSDSLPVLICDDEPRLTMLTAGLLEQHGVSTQVVYDGEAALELASKRAFRMLLLDVNLGGMTALEVLHGLDAAGVELRVLLSSGYAAEDLPAELREHPRVAGFLAKPYPVERLLSALQ